MAYGSLRGKGARAAALGVALVACLAHASAIRGGFLNWDDDTYLLDNPLVEAISPEHLARMFTSSHAANWHPLTWLSHAADLALFGRAPAGHHAVSVLLHAANAALLFLALRGLTGAGGRSAAVALLFGAHPLRVESVAWLSERKDLLCGFFVIATLAAHARHAARPSPARYAAVVGAHALALLSKPMAVTVPIVLLILDAWPLRRLSLAALLEKVPLLALSAAAGVATVAAQSAGGATVALEAIPLHDRAGNAFVAVASYVAKTLAPIGLSPYTPFPGVAGAPPRPDVVVALSALAVGGASAAVSRAARRAPYFAVGWAWFLVMLVPVVGLVQVGSQAMADRYTYLPTVGLLVAIVWGLGDAFAGAWNAAGRHPTARRRALAIAAAPAAAVALAVVVLAALSWKQTAHWRDSESLWRRALEIGPPSAVAHNNLGRALVAAGRVDEGIARYAEALRLDPDFELAHFNLGIALASQGRGGEAMAAFEAALRARPDFPEARYQIANRLARAGRVDEAIAAYRELVRAAPRHALAQYDLGVLLAARGERDEAIARFRAAIAARPRYAEALVNLAALLVERGDLAEARRLARRVLAGAPAPAPAQAEQARALLREIERLSAPARAPAGAPGSPSAPR